MSGTLTQLQLLYVEFEETKSLTGIEAKMRLYNPKELTIDNAQKLFARSLGSTMTKGWSLNGAKLLKFQRKKAGTRDRRGGTCTAA
jgi:hypothetical protein